VTCWQRRRDSVMQRRRERRAVSGQTDLGDGEGWQIDLVKGTETGPSGRRGALSIVRWVTGRTV
jgi:hypothetical protein